jgi:chain length determinant protein EpsF
VGFGRFLIVLRARFGLIASITALAVIAAAVLSIAMPPRYYAEASAVLEQPALDSSVIAAGGSSAINFFLSTQRDVVASRNVALRVIESLGLERDPDKSRRLLSGWNPLSTARDWVLGLFPGPDSGEPPLREWLSDRLLKGLSLSSGHDSRLLKVGFNSRNPEFSATVANAFMRAFLEVNVHLKAAPARTETAWLEGQLKDLRETLAQAENKLSDFQQKKGIVATDERIDYENVRLADLSTQLAGAQSDAYGAEARRQQLRQFAAGKGGEVPADVVTSPVVMQLRQDIAQRQAKLSDMSREVGPNHPRYRAAAGELAQMRGQLATEMRSVAQGLASAGSVAGQREASLRGALEQQKAHLLGMKKDREAMAMLERDVDNAQRAYNGAVQRVSQARIESASERPNASVVDDATVPSRAAGPRLPLNLAIGGVLGIVFGLGLALQLESTYRLVRSEDDLVEFLGVPMLAALPPRSLRGNAVRALSANVYSLPKP